MGVHFFSTFLGHKGNTRSFACITQGKCQRDMVKLLLFFMAMSEELQRI